MRWGLNFQVCQHPIVESQESRMDHRARTEQRVPVHETVRSYLETPKRLYTMELYILAA